VKIRVILEATRNAHIAPKASKFAILRQSGAGGASRQRAVNQQANLSPRTPNCIFRIHAGNANRDQGKHEWEFIMVARGPFQNGENTHGAHIYKIHAARRK
jgi:hypothetical protein